MELIKISTLQARYRLDSRQAIYSRINGLGLKPVDRGRISCEQLDILDKLDEHIRGGGAIADFPKVPDILDKPLDKLDKPLDIEPEPSDALALMAGLLEKMIQMHYSPSPLANYEELEKAVQHEWVLPSSTVAALIGVHPRGDSFTWGNLIFLKFGKLGRQSGWLIKKQTTRFIAN